MRYLVTGGAGFIGSALVRQLVIEDPLGTVIVADKLTYAGNLDALSEVSEFPRFHFEKIDICDDLGVRVLLWRYRPDCIVHLASETHVDRSIDGPAAFVQTNIVGTYTLLEAARSYWTSLPEDSKEQFRFLHVSTDEVFGSMAAGELATESTSYRPSSPYAASKAAADHLVRAWHTTYGLPVLLTNCTNNYGPFQFPEKLIPLMLLSAAEGRPLPVYGDGGNVRDWLYVDDHCRAIRLVLSKGRPGHSYNIAAGAEKTNVEIVKQICALMQELRPLSNGDKYADLIRFVEDRPGHDRRYALDAGKVRTELGWQPRESFESGLRKTVEWYLENGAWGRDGNKGYHGERLGVLS